MIRSLTLSLLLVSTVATAAETTPVQRIDDERLTMTSLGQLRKGGNAFNPVFTFQAIPAKARVARNADDKPAQQPQPAPAPKESRGEVQEL